ncbi:MAG: HAD hydrolase-like protein [Candidatus Marinimicrobia bacterium]|nr:HAD hydrolase-like protein [Candidatus Neomarinimicrobiota bacterium]
MKKRLFLFDIDGTLLSPGPSARTAINQAIENFTGVPPNLQIKDVAGMTDRLIVKNALERSGTDSDITETINNVINDYLTLFESTYYESKEAFVYEDALELVRKVKGKGYPLGLLTGNVKRGAHIKLRRFDLMKHFSFGAYGDDGETRSDLPIVARNRAKEVLGKTFEFDEIVLVGDTPEDAIAAKVNGCKSIIVCRRYEWYDDIVSAGADLIVDSLNDTAINI